MFYRWIVLAGQLWLLRRARLRFKSLVDPLNGVAVLSDSTVVGLSKEPSSKPLEEPNKPQLAPVETPTTPLVPRRPTMTRSISTQRISDVLAVASATKSSSVRETVRPLTIARSPSTQRISNILAEVMCSPGDGGDGLLSMRLGNLSTDFDAEGIAAAFRDNKRRGSPVPIYPGSRNGQRRRSFFSVPTSSTSIGKGRGKKKVAASLKYRNISVQRIALLLLLGSVYASAFFLR